jgi:hypothetical protein
VKSLDNPIYQNLLDTIIMFHEHICPNDFILVHIIQTSMMTRAFARLDLSKIFLSLYIFQVFTQFILRWLCAIPHGIKIMELCSKTLCET